MSFGFQVWEECDGDTKLVVAKGDLDLSSVPQLGRPLADLDGVRGLVLDLTGVTFMDASGARTLLETTARASELAVDLVIFAPFAPADRVLRLTGVADELPLVAIRQR